MPAETIIVLAAVIATFVFFAGAVTFADLTWSKGRDKDDGLQG
jgi:hypothetical protein